MIIEGDSIDMIPVADTLYGPFDAMVTDPPAGISFMRKGWDHHKGGREGWARAFAAVFAGCLDALKPGAHALVWALPRTSHWTACALEDAGFEVRDVLTHHFGTGFPKSLDAGKAIDKRLGAKGSQGEMKRGGERLLWQTSDGSRSGDGTWGDESGRNAYTYVPATPEAQRWDGWGTALKPASEHWILARRPLDGTVAANLLAHGAGAINVGACRVETDENLGGGAYAKQGNRQDLPGAERSAKAAGMMAASKTIGKEFVQPTGRWPANVLLTHYAECDGEHGCVPWCPVAEMDRQGGAGGASRFFPRFRYQAKTPSRERSAGLPDGEKNRHPTVKSVELMRWLVRLVTPPGGLVLDPFCGSGSTGVAALAEGMRFVGVEREAEYAAVARARLGIE